MIAAILLDRESRSVILDADASHGSLLEPFLKVVRIMRSLNYKGYGRWPLIDFDRDVQDLIGQEAFEIPSVFSYFLPEFEDAGTCHCRSLMCFATSINILPQAIEISRPFW